MRAIIAGITTSSILTVALATSAFAAPPIAKLAPGDIQTTFFNGTPFTAATTSNVKYKMTFSADGKMKREPVGQSLPPATTNGRCCEARPSWRRGASSSAFAQAKDGLRVFRQILDLRMLAG
jgi:hypothetical protein